MDVGCPCGCPLQLSPSDQSEATRLLAIMGSHGTYHETAAPMPRRERAEPPEPTREGICRGCGARIELAVFLVAFLDLKSAVWPMCGRCNGAGR